MDGKLSTCLKVSELGPVNPAMARLEEIQYIREKIGLFCFFCGF